MWSKLELYLLFFINIYIVNILLINKYEIKIEVYLLLF